MRKTLFTACSAICPGSATAQSTQAQKKKQTSPKTNASTNQTHTKDDKLNQEAGSENAPLNAVGRVSFFLPLVA